MHKTMLQGGVNARDTGSRTGGASAHDITSSNSGVQAIRVGENGYIVNNGCIDLSSIARVYGVDFPGGLVPVNEALRIVSQTGNPGLINMVKAINNNITGNPDVNSITASALDAMSEQSEPNAAITKENTELRQSNIHARVQNIVLLMMHRGLPDSIVSCLNKPVTSKNELLDNLEQTSRNINRIFPGEHSDIRNGIDALTKMVDELPDDAMVSEDAPYVSDNGNLEEATEQSTESIVDNEVTKFDDVEQVIPDVGAQSDVGYWLAQYNTNMFAFVPNALTPYVQNKDPVNNRYESGGDSPSYRIVNPGDNDVRTVPGYITQNNPAYQHTTNVFVSLPDVAAQYTFSIFAGIFAMQYVNINSAAPFNPSFDAPPGREREIVNIMQTQGIDKVPVRAGVIPDYCRYCVSKSDLRYPHGFNVDRAWFQSPLPEFIPNVDTGRQGINPMCYFDGCGSNVPLTTEDGLPRLFDMYVDPKSLKLVLPSWAPMGVSLDGRFAQDPSVDRANIILSPLNYTEQHAALVHGDVNDVDRLKQLTLGGTYYTYACVARHLIESFMYPSWFRQQSDELDSSDVSAVEKVLSSKMGTLTDDAKYESILANTKHLTDLGTFVRKTELLNTVDSMNPASFIINRITKSLNTIKASALSVIATYTSYVSSFRVLIAIKACFVQFIEDAKHDHTILNNIKSYQHFQRLAWCIKICRHIGSAASRVTLENLHSQENMTNLSGGIDHDHVPDTHGTLISLVNSWVSDLRMPSISSAPLYGGVGHDIYTSTIDNLANIFKLTMERYDVDGLFMLLINKGDSMQTFSNEYLAKLSKSVGLMVTDLTNTASEDARIDKLSICKQAELIRDKLLTPLIDVNGALENEFVPLKCDLQDVFDIFNRLTTIDWIGNDVGNITFNDVAGFVATFSDLACSAKSNDANVCRIRKVSTYALIPSSEYSEPADFQFILKITDVDRHKITDSVSKMVEALETCTPKVVEGLNLLKEHVIDPKFIITVVDRFPAAESNIVTVVRDMYDDVLGIRNAYEQVSEVFDALVRPRLVPKSLRAMYGSGQEGVDMSTVYTSHAMDDILKPTDVLNALKSSDADVNPVIKAIDAKFDTMNTSGDQFGNMRIADISESSMSTEDIIKFGDMLIGVDSDGVHADINAGGVNDMDDKLRVALQNKMSSMLDLASGSASNMIAYFGTKTDMMCHMIQRMYGMTNNPHHVDDVKYWDDVGQVNAIGINAPRAPFVNDVLLHNGHHDEERFEYNTVTRYFSEHIVPLIGNIRDRFIALYGGIGEYLGLIDDFRALNVLYEHGLYRLDLMVTQMHVLGSLYCMMTDTLIGNNAIGIQDAYNDIVNGTEVRQRSTSLANDYNKFITGVYKQAVRNQFAQKYSLPLDEEVAESSSDVGESVDVGSAAGEGMEENVDSSASALTGGGCGKRCCLGKGIAGGGVMDPVLDIIIVSLKTTIYVLLISILVIGLVMICKEYKYSKDMELKTGKPKKSMWSRVPRITLPFRGKLPYVGKL